MSNSEAPTLENGESSPHGTPSEPHGTPSNPHTGSNSFSQPIFSFFRRCTQYNFPWCTRARDLLLDTCECARFAGYRTLATASSDLEIYGPRTSNQKSSGPTLSDPTPADSPFSRPETFNPLDYGLSTFSSESSGPSTSNSEIYGPEARRLVTSFFQGTPLVYKVFAPAPPPPPHPGSPRPGSPRSGSSRPQFPLRDISSVAVSLVRTSRPDTLPFHRRLAVLTGKCIDSAGYERRRSAFQNICVQGGERISNFLAARVKIVETKNPPPSDEAPLDEEATSNSKEAISRSEEAISRSEEAISHNKEAISSNEVAIFHIEEGISHNEEAISNNGEATSSDEAT